MQWYKFTLSFMIYFSLAAHAILFGQNNSEPVISGELKKWHNITLTFAGPQTAEDAEPNPFVDYRLNVTYHLVV